MTWMQRLYFLFSITTVLLLLHVTVFAVGIRVYELEVPHFILYSLLVSMVMMVFNAGPRIKDTVVTSSLYIVSSTWLGFLFLFFSATIVYELVRFLTGEFPLLYMHLMTIAGLAGLYALYNARKLTIKELTLPVTGLATPVRIVHLSDVHIGTVHRTSFLKKVVTMTNACSPDLVLMTGDLFDGSAPIHEEMLAPLNEIKSNTYFSTGNHEEYEGLALVRETIKSLRMRLLDSEVVHDHGLQIIGVNDRQSLPKAASLKTILPTLEYDQQQPSILLYHTPVEWDEAKANGIDLMLSGHTHNGQLFPFTLLVHLAYKHVRGLYSDNNKYLHVTPGTGTWGPPMRLGSRNQITVINLKPNTD